MNWNAERLVVGGFLVALAVLVGIGYFGQRTSDRLALYVSAVGERHIVLQRLAGIQSGVTAAESAQRGFVITGEEAFLGGEDEEAVVRDHLAELRGLLASDPQQLLALDVLEPLLARRFELIASSVRTIREQRYESARAAVAAGEGLRLQEQIVAMIEGLETRADRALAEAQQRAEHAARQLRQAILLGVALALLLVGIAVRRALHDVRALRRAEAHLREGEQRQRELNVELERRNRALHLAGTELAQARDRARAADRMKSAFLATMSHELRTPLNSVIGFTGVLMQSLPGPLNEEQRKQLGIVRASGQHLLALINDVLDLSKIEAGQLQVAREPFDLRASIERVIESLRPQAVRKGLSLEVAVADGLGTMTGDARRFEQVLLNLVSNAVKFTERGGVTVSVELATDARLGAGDAGPAVRVRVSDTGCGIRPEDLPRLFKPFEQLGVGLARPHDGTGLGLAISQRLARLMHGTLEAESRWQHGSVFTLILPLLPGTTQ